MALRTLKPRIQNKMPERAKPNTTATRRMTGRKLQERRLSMWTANPHCAICGRFTQYPGGFELDHVVSLHAGGGDTEDNAQVLCVHYDAQGVKQGCHVDKTAQDMKG